MSIKGRPQTWLERAIANGQLAVALGEASELRPLDLNHALGVLCLLHEARDPRAPRAGARWAARLTLERPGVDVDALAALAAALQHAHTCPGGPRPALRELAQRYELPVAGLLAQPQRSRPR